MIITSTVQTYGGTEPAIILITARVVALKMSDTKIVIAMEKTIPEII